MKTKEQISKKVWTKPDLKVHGTIEEITQQTEKYIGSEDNLIYIVNSDITVGDS